MTADVVSPSTINSSESSRFTSLRTVLGEWKQLFEGCNFIKRKERSRSRRKPRGIQSNRVVSASVAQRSSTQKSQSTELCVCDSIDDQMIEKFTVLPAGIDTREWLATHSNKFSGEFESHIRRVIRLLWHCCGHLCCKHWEELGHLELRPQCALVMAHLARLSKTFALLDSKDQQLINNTVQSIRPLHIVAVGMLEDSTIPPAQRWSRVPSSKSGSWGGHPTPAVLSCKPYAQTC
uniref:Ras-GEF domain-containing protein n=1 Tax=Heterorhabditis bacteriophora TaxID=37862 RepID=A0A1I7WLF3_HETBA